MSIEDTISNSVQMEWALCASSLHGMEDSQDTKDDIDRHVRRMLRFEKRHKINATMSDEQICGVLSSGLLMWLFWQIAPELLMWIIAAVRKRIWNSTQQKVAE
jgi:hypothetical protein